MSGEHLGFEDMDVWVRCHQLSNEICRIAEEGKLKRNVALSDQMLRAAVSVISNLGEGFDRTPVRERIYFLNVAKGSVGELRAQAILAGDRRYIDETDFRTIMDLTNQSSRLLAGLTRYLQSVNKRQAAASPSDQTHSRRPLREDSIGYADAREPHPEFEFDFAAYLEFTAQDTPST